MKEVNKQTILKIISHQKIAFISSIDNDGYPVTKAMLEPRKINGLNEFYFTTNTSSERVKQFVTEPKSSLYFCDQRFFRGVLLKGTMEVLTDATSKEMIWQEGDTIYYSKGVTDPDYCVLKFTAFSGRYYSNFNSKDFTITAADIELTITK